MQEENPEDSENPTIVRAPLPRNENQLIGILEQRLGGNKMMIVCSDGKSRNCRVPGRLKKNLWLRPKDVVMIELWEFDKNKADIILKYRSAQIIWLKKNDLKKIISDHDFVERIYKCKEK